MNILGRASGTPEQALKWFSARADDSYLEPDHRSLKTIIGAYQEIGERTNVDWFMALAQCAHETNNLTSWWCLRPYRNPAGIGVTGRTRQKAPQSGAWAQKGNIWVEGVSFATWANDAVPAHLGRLLAYCMKDNAANDEQRKVIWQAMNYRRLPAWLRGVAIEWKDLNGKWAVPGAAYGQNIEKLAEWMRKSN